VAEDIAIVDDVSLEVLLLPAENLVLKEAWGRLKAYN
jgi:hypothetical protein